MDIKLSSGKIIKDHHKLDNIPWRELIEYAYKRLGVTKKDFSDLIGKKREKEIELQYKLMDYDR